MNASDIHEIERVVRDATIIVEKYFRMEANQHFAGGIFCFHSYSFEDLGNIEEHFKIKVIYFVKPLAVEQLEYTMKEVVYTRSRIDAGPDINGDQPYVWKPLHNGIRIDAVHELWSIKSGLESHLAKLYSEIRDKTEFGRGFWSYFKNNWRTDAISAGGELAMFLVSMGFATKYTKEENAIKNTKLRRYPKEGTIKPEGNTETMLVSILESIAFPDNDKIFTIELDNALRISYQK